MTDQQLAIAALIEAVEMGEYFPRGLRSRALGHNGSAALVCRARDGSLDAALALHAALLPGWGHVVGDEVPGSNASRASVFSADRTASEHERAASPSLAWLIAILKAYNTTLGEVAA
jgi:hypothetical protein